MKIAVATIVKNEEQFIDRWAASAEDADLLVMGDTGSTDGTRFRCESQGIEVHDLSIDPWRFDLARNALYALIPPWIDWVISVDADEVLTEGWREQMEATAVAYPEARRMSYLYTWSWVEGYEGEKPNVIFRTDKCTTRRGWMWKGACHEVLTPSGVETRGLETVYGGFGIEHYPDHTKSRDSYLGLLEQAVFEEPHNPRQAYYLGREYYFAGAWDKARAELLRYLKMPEARWPPERAAAWRLIAKMDNEPERWFMRCITECPERREGWVDLAHWYAEHGQVDAAAGIAARALSITERTYDFLTEAAAWDDTELRKLAGWIPDNKEEAS